MSKIQKIRDVLDHHPTYEPTDTIAHCKMSEDDVERIIKENAN